LHLITLRHTTLGYTPLNEGQSRRRDLYLYNTRHNRQTSMPPARFEASERPQTYALDRAATGIGSMLIHISNNIRTT